MDKQDKPGHSLECFQVDFNDKQFKVSTYLVMFVQFLTLTEGVIVFLTPNENLFIYALYV
jgi:hypothetical protein